MEFYKVSGAGNDFLAVPVPCDSPPQEALPLEPEQVRRWCQRGLSVGADGLFLLHQGEPGEVTMEHFNADGTRAELCINGTRCAARLAFELGWAEGRVLIHTDAFSIPGESSPGEGEVIALEIPIPSVDPTPITIKVDDTPWSGHLLSVGVPHLVLPWNRPIQEAPMATVGAALVHHPQVGPAGANINLVQFCTRNHLEVRTYERGVNGETLACGTGVLAAVACSLALDEAQLPVVVGTLGGFQLRVETARKVDRNKAWRLVGDARLIARGTLLPGASTLPPTPTS